MLFGVAAVVAVIITAVIVVMIIAVNTGLSVRTFIAVAAYKKTDVCAIASD